jgi:hypothetical protein
LKYPHCSRSRNDMSPPLRFTCVPHSFTRPQYTRCQCLCSPAHQSLRYGFLLAHACPYLHATQKSCTERLLHSVFKATQPLVLATAFVPHSVLTASFTKWSQRNCCNHFGYARLWALFPALLLQLQSKIPDWLPAEVSRPGYVYS